MIAITTTNARPAIELPGMSGMSRLTVHSDPRPNCFSTVGPFMAWNRRRP